MSKLLVRVPEVEEEEGEGGHRRLRECRSVGCEARGGEEVRVGKGDEGLNWRNVVERHSSVVFDPGKEFAEAVKGCEGVLREEWEGRKTGRVEWSLMMIWRP